jgi:hypothetical protein
MSVELFKIFLVFTGSIPALGPTQPTSKWVSTNLSPGVKRPGHVIDHSPPPSVEVKNTWSYMSTPPMCLRCADNVFGSSSVRILAGTQDTFTEMFVVFLSPSGEMSV